MRSGRNFFIVLAVLLPVIGSGTAAETTRVVRLLQDGDARYGLQRGEEVELLSAAPWSGGEPTGQTVRFREDALLAPVEPRQVFAVGFNYRSHRGDRELPPHPPIFLKLPSSVIGPGEEIVYPPAATNVHYEAELVVVIGREGRHIAPEDAADYIFGVTAGNDVSARDWQADDLQWFRAKASATFAPVGPAVVRGLDYRDLLVQSRLNGETRQRQSSRDHIHDIHAIVSHISKYATLYPGDLIFTGTPGETAAMSAGDVVEVEVAGVGVLRNRVAGAAKENR